MNDLRQRWAEGRATHGLWSLLPGAVTGEVLARTGADYVVVDLQHGVRGVPRLRQGGGVSGRHVGAEGVGRHRSQYADRGGGQSGGGRLAVGAGDQGDIPAGRQMGEEVRVDLQADPSADHGTVAPPGGAGQSRSRTRH